MMRKLSTILTLALSLIYVGCSENSFQDGGNTPKKQEKPIVKTDRTSAAATKPAKIEKKAEIEEIEDTIDASPDRPDDAVVQGSFAAWTEPSDPAMLQSYYIIIEVEYGSAGLPANVRADLTGQVVGTDGYQQRIAENPTATNAFDQGYGPDFYDPHVSQQLETYDQKARLKIFVPGAANLVRDTITVQSQSLSENQNIEIVF